MAEAFPDDHDLPADLQKPISVLILGTLWQFDTYGLSTINKSLVNDLRIVDPHGQIIKITCAVLQDDLKIKDEDLKDAAKYGVELTGAKRPRGSKRRKRPKLQWMDKNTTAYYPHLVQDQNYDFIIGHAPYLANGCLNLKGFHKNRKDSTKVILMFHGLPKDENGGIDDETLLDWLTEANVIFSVGKAIEDELLPYIASLDPKKRPVHKMYIPSYPLELFAVKQNNIEGKVRGTQSLSITSGEIKDLDINGLDFPLAVTATARASEHVGDFDRVRINLNLLVANEDEKKEWKETFDQIISSGNLKDTGLSFQVEAPMTIDKMEIHMRKSNLFLLPLKQNSPLFGTEALSAIAAGVPVLVSRYSGLASLLREMQQEEAVVPKDRLEILSETWKRLIVQKLTKPKEAHRAAVRLREQLLLETSIAQTHLDFINSIADTDCVKFKMDIETDSIISEEHIKKATEFGIEWSVLPKMDVKQYTIAFMKRLLLQNEKLKKNLLEVYLNPEVTKLWQEVLFSLENTNRKLINISSGSLILTLFCPTYNSLQQLQDEKWRIDLQAKVEKLLKALGVEARTRTTEPLASTLFRRAQELKTTDSDERSLGYETMTTLSDPDSVVLRSQMKVGHWLSEQYDVKSRDDDQSWKLVETWKIYHVQTREDKRIYISNRFSMSESGAIGISCEEKPSLSMMYPGTGKPPTVLSKGKTIYRSATFLKVHDTEYLAAAGSMDGCLFFWNIESKTAKKVFDPKLPTGQTYKDMNICKIDESIIGYGEVCATTDGSRRVFILNTDKEELILSSTLRLFTPGEIWDICYTEVEGTPCLLLCVPHAHRIMAVEMISAKTRWEAGREQMGEKFYPWSICIDQNNTIYVADIDQRMIHLMSAADGSVIKQINGNKYGISNIVTVRFHDQHLYVEHVIPEPRLKYAISKFKEIEEVQ